jgi:hypothetical protein
MLQRHIRSKTQAGWRRLALTTTQSKPVTAASFAECRDALVALLQYHHPLQMHQLQQQAEAGNLTGAVA